MNQSSPSIRPLLQNAVLEIRHLRSELAALKSAACEPIAVVGIGCRFPGGANSPGKFWELLREGRDAIREVPPGRWNVDAFYDPRPDIPGKMYTRLGGYLDSVDQFEPGFFGISPREARAMDPQQRLLLEVGWETLEDAGQAPHKLAGTRTGVFVGLCFEDYAQRTARVDDCSRVDAYSSLGGARSIGVGRLSYFLNLRGPNVQIDTACSSSLVAIHLACQSLRTHESDLALAGGVNVILSPSSSVGFCSMRALSPDGRCKAFDARANGYARGEGCGMVLLKRLSQAEKDGDRIYAVLRGSAVNHDGRTNGLTAPNGSAQQEVIRQALSVAGLPPEAVGYVEAHGTGTILGDPIEAGALSEVYGKDRTDPLLIGTVKTNIGHLEAAAGVAALIKVALSMHRREIPPHLHYEKPNPHIPFEEYRLKVVRELTPWAPSPAEVRAGISSFGMSGTNAHLIVESAPVRPAGEAQARRPLELFTLSARSDAALKNLAKDYARVLKESPPGNLHAVCSTANAGRTHFSSRLAICEESLPRLVDRLNAFAGGTNTFGVYQGTVRPGDRPKVAFLFTGQGSQYAGMGAKLYEAEPVFRRTLEECQEILRDCLDRPLLSILFPGPDDIPVIDETLFAQPALFSLEVALAELWRSWGIVPDAVFGHSVGEYAAAYVAGVFDLETGLKMIAERARLMHSLPKDGQMAMVFTNPDEVVKTLADFHDEVSLAAVNGPDLTVISGTKDGVQETLRRFATKGVRHQVLQVSHAFHSHLLDPILDAFQTAVSAHTFRTPRVPFISNLTGECAGAKAALDAIYWREQMRQPVQFARAMQTLVSQGCAAFLECGPTPTLLSMGKRCLPVPPAGSLWLSSLRRGAEDLRMMLEAAAQLHTAGFDLDWTGFHGAAPERPAPVSLPTYAFERERFWLELDKSEKIEPGACVNEGLERVKEAGAAACDRAMTPSELAQEKLKLEALNDYCDSQVSEALMTLGLLAGRPKAEIPGMLERAGVLPVYRKLASLWLERPSSPSTTLRDPRKLWARVESLWRSEPELPELARACGEKLVDILTGQVDPLSLLFPNGSSAKVEAIYRDATISRFCNRLMESVLPGLLEQFAPTDEVQILEIGGGTGGTTRSLLPVLRSRNARYHFTDIGHAFVQQASEKWGANGKVICKLLDIERSPEEQGFPPETFQIVVAANVLHATRDIRATLRNVRSLMAPGGYVMLWEATAPQSCFNLTFGLLEGWQRFKDEDLRPGHPLLTPDQWKRAFEEAGLVSVAAFPASGTPHETLGQHVLIARREPEVQAVASTGPAPAVVKEPLTYSGLGYEVEWKEAPAFDGSASAEPSHYVLLAEPTPRTLALRELLTSRGNRVTVVQCCGEFRECSPGEFRIRPEKADFERLFAELESAHPGEPIRILHLWGWDRVRGERNVSGVEGAFDSGLMPLLAALQALGGRERKANARIFACTRGVHRIREAGCGPDASFQSMVWGLGRTAAREYPKIWGGLIDCDPNGSESEVVALAEAFSRLKEPEYAIRGGRWFVPRLISVRDPASETGPVGISAQASYLITGGLGGIGLTVARELVHRGARRLVLMGRTPMPPRAEWRAKAQEKTETGERIRGILELETLGASVHVATVDVGNWDDLSAFLSKFEQEAWPAIRGVFHAAGTTCDRPLGELDRSSLEAVLHPKVRGAVNLAKYFGDRLDFMAFFSSAASLFGPVTGANYAAANSFLGGLAAELRSRGIRAVSLEWGPWAETGMARREQRGERLERQGFLPISPSQAIGAMRAALAEDRAQLALVRAEWPGVSRAVGHTPLLDELVGGTAGASAGKTPISEEESGQDDVMKFLKRHASELLGMSVGKLDPERPLADFGLDSIMAVQIKNEVEIAYGVIIPLGEFVRGSLKTLRERVVATRR